MLKQKLISSLSEMFTFEGDSAKSQQGLLRISFHSEKDISFYFILPRENSPETFLYMGALITFLETVAPELEGKENFIRKSCISLVTENIPHIIKNYKECRIEVKLERHLNVGLELFDVRVRRS
jgi:hypothetical protein